ncbi:MAG TPA: hypothetical protein VFA18_03705, partial [Gemmataceae bacterium]|nr:hypothetical protein [Gemmataceae bacterium]
ILAVVAVVLFEWRVRSENKSLIRGASLGTVAAALTAAAALTGASLVIPYMVAAPASGRIARPFALDQIASIETSVRAIEQALPKRDWTTMQEQAHQAAQAVDRLASAAPAVGALTRRYEPPTLTDLRAELKSASESLAAVRQASLDKDTEHIQASLKQFHAQFGPIVEAARKPQR